MCSARFGVRLENAARSAAGKKYLRALDIETGKVVWEVPQTGPIEGKRWAGVLATAGGLLLYGDPNGDLVAVDQKDGKPLWHIPTNVHDQDRSDHLHRRRPAVHRDRGGLRHFVLRPAVTPGDSSFTVGAPTRAATVRESATVRAGRKSRMKVGAAWRLGLSSGDSATRPLGAVPPRPS